MVTTSLVLLLVLIGISIPVGAALGVLGLILEPLYSFLPLTKAIGEVSWGTSNEFLLVAIPLFIMLGEILLRSGIADRMYNAMSLWLSWLPGGLMHANIGASALFAATSGSSVATAATVGTVALPQIKRQKYNEPLFLGSLAAGGTLGILIPPSINLIIRSEEHTSELQSRGHLVCRLLLEKKQRPGGGRRRRTPVRRGRR